MEEHRQARLEELRRTSNLELLAHMTLGTFRPEGYALAPRQRENLRRAYELAQRYAEDPQGWLILIGGYGCGKTHLAAAIANQRVERGQPTLFVTVPDLLDHLRAAFSPDSEIDYDQRFEEVRTAPLLILDDLGTHSATPWAQEKLYQIVNYRYNARLPSVITTNHRLEDLDRRLVSRMTDAGLCQVYHIMAGDFRASGVDRSEELSTLNLYADKTFEKFDLRRGELPPEEERNLKSALSIAQGYAEDPEGWLVFTGEYGCGKTHLAASIANHRKAQGHTVHFVVVPDFLDHLRAAFNPNSPISSDKLFEEVRSSPFLVLDDLETRSATPWALDKLYQLFNYRYVAKLPTVITMREALEEADPRLASRMLDISLCTVYAILAPSYRGGVPPRLRGSRSRTKR